MEDTIKLPLDADGVPIRPGDTVFRVVDGTRYSAVSVEMTSLGNWWLHAEDVRGFRSVAAPGDVTHEAPDAMASIEKAIYGLAMSEHQEHPEEDVKAIMERIKRMVER